MGFSVHPHRRLCVPQPSALSLLGCLLFAFSPASAQDTPDRFHLPNHWTRQGLVLPRQNKDFGVSGDPCIVWDDDGHLWRMVLFYAPPGHAQAVCDKLDANGVGEWKLLGPIPMDLPPKVDSMHKPFVVMDPHHFNMPAKVEGKFYLLTVGFSGGHKLVYRASATTLAGPWKFEQEPLIPRGAAGEFDEKHTDAVTGYYFPERKEFLYFYMGYPAGLQPRRQSPFGSAQAVAVQKVGEATVHKLGVVLPPSQEPGHWAGGWVGGMQLLPGAEHRWIAIVNASPTAPDPAKKDVWTEEPPPSLGGFAWSDEEWPTTGWHFAPQPIEWVKDIPQSAIDAGEGTNLWRQFIHVLPNGHAALFYNSGYYGREQLYLKTGE